MTAIPRQASLLLRAGFEHGFDGVGFAPGVPRLKQVHGTLIVEREALAADGVEADGMCSRRPGATVAVRTADCLPVLLADRQRRLVLAVHAGWRGVLAGMVPRAIAHAAEHGVPAQALLMAIGPAISRASFEVGPELASQFQAHWPTACERGEGDRWHVDLALVATLQAVAAGMPPDAIEASPVCTVRDERWHSYRRERAAGGQLSGSNWSWIKL